MLLGFRLMISAIIAGVLPEANRSTVVISVSVRLNCSRRRRCFIALESLHWVRMAQALSGMKKCRNRGGDLDDQNIDRVAACVELIGVAERQARVAGQCVAQLGIEAVADFFGEERL